MEHLGNFDEGGDVMTQAQQDAIVRCNALLCVKFGLLPQPEQVVYHHWFDRQGSRFPGTEVDSGLVLRQQKQKTCPEQISFRNLRIRSKAIRSKAQKQISIHSSVLKLPGCKMSTNCYALRPVSCKCQQTQCQSG
jgi:hypothetical protein